MPLFEYKCAACGSLNEVLVGVVSQETAGIPLCESCGSSELKRMLSRINIGGRVSALAFSGGQGECGMPGGGCCGGACQGH